MAGTFKHPAWTQSQDYPADTDRGIIQLLCGGIEQVVAGFQVTPRAQGANFSVDVTAGQCFIQGDDAFEQGFYFCNSPLADNVLFPAPPGTGSRIDVLCCQVNDPDSGGRSGYTYPSEFVVVSGDISTSGAPVEPDAPNTALKIWAVPRPAGQIAITSTDLAGGDRRYFHRRVQFISDPAALSGLVLYPGDVVAVGP
jgi:hypothetical protein